jgi:hypothetical protein
MSPPLLLEPVGALALGAAVASASPSRARSRSSRHGAIDCDLIDALPPTPRARSWAPA